MTKLRLRIRAPMILPIVTIVIGLMFLGLAEALVWGGRVYDLTVPARCTLVDSGSHQVGPGVFVGVVDMRVVDANTHQVVADRVGQQTPDDPTSTREKADALARAWLQAATRDYDCYYHPRNPTWTTTQAHGDYGVVWVSAVLGISSFAFGVWILAAWYEGTAPDGSPLVSHLEYSTLERTSPFLPDRPPASWGPYDARDGKWTCDIDDEIRMVVAAPERVAGAMLFVALGPKPKKKGKGRVTDERARRILADFRGVGEFGEAAGAFAEEQLRRKPGVRVFIAPCAQTTPSLKPSMLSRPKDEALNDFLVQARQHLPEKLPEGWTTPVAVFDDEKETDGAWMFSVDDLDVMLALCSSDGVVKLTVGFSHASLEPVHEWQAIEVLKHMRQIREFKQIASPEDVPTVRVFLGELGPAKESVAMN